LLPGVFEGRMEGKRSRGRPRVKMLIELIGDEHYSVIKRRALDRDEWKGWLRRTCSELMFEDRTLIKFQILILLLSNLQSVRCIII